jgi:hypothetical protein
MLRFKNNLQSAAYLFSAWYSYRVTRLQIHMHAMQNKHIRESNEGGFTQPI